MSAPADIAEMAAVEIAARTVVDIAAVNFAEGPVGSAVVVAAEIAVAANAAAEPEHFARSKGQAAAPHFAAAMQVGSGSRSVRKISNLPMPAGARFCRKEN